MRLMTRAASLAISSLLVVTVLSHTAAADDPDPVVDEGGGAFTGAHQVDRSRDNRKPRGDSDTATTREGDDEPDDITMFVCDGAPSVHSPYDCPGYEPPPDLDQVTAEQLARRIIVRLQLPTPTPQFGPDPAVNEWEMAAVGYPLWLWTEGPRTLTSTESAYGLSFTLQAHYRSTTFTMGDGHTKQCTNTTPYSRSVKPGTPSPTCGYTYLDAARGDGSYTVTATTHWDVDWSVAGFSGTLPGTHSASRSLRVGELQAIVVK